MNNRFNPDQLFEEIPTEQTIVVAVSGGSDSLALLLLISAWANKCGARFQVVTVDHGLRPEAAAEAAFVAGTCEGLGVPHVTLAWEGLKPTSGLPEASRIARYQIMEEFARDIGANVIVTGHTSDDQAETVWMRLGREANVNWSAGLSGMATVTRLPGGSDLHRPLLRVSRDELRSVLRQNAQCWIEDPSNEDLSYERVRVRHQLNALPETKERLLAFSVLCGRHRRLVSQQVASFLSNHLSTSAGMVMSIAFKDFTPLPRAVKQGVIRSVLAVCGGQERFVSPQKIDAVLKFLADDSGVDTTVRMTIGNCVIVHQQHSFAFYRETRNLAPILLSGQDRAIWDGRVEIVNDTNRSIYIGALEKDQLADLEALYGGRFESRPRAALLTLLTMRFDDDDLCVPSLGVGQLPNGVTLRPVCKPLEHFVPAFDRPLTKWFYSIRGQLLADHPAKH